MKPVPVLNPRILLVDDNRDGLLVRRALLEEAGCTVEIAINGEEGLKLFEASDFDVVVTDYRMPRMNGAELISGFAGGIPTPASSCSPVSSSRWASPRKVPGRTP